MAINYDDFIETNRKKTEEVMKHLTLEMMEVLGIKPGLDGYMRWMLSREHYEHTLRLDNSIADENFDQDLEC